MSEKSSEEHANWKQTLTTDMKLPNKQTNGPKIT